MSADYQTRAAQNRAEPGSPLAKARIAAHGAFDVLWQSGSMSRGEAYQWLADQLGIPKHECHMVYFDEVTCDRVRRICDQYMFKELFDL